MNTPAHLIFGLAAFGKPQQRAVTAAALIGAMLPDLSLYVLVAWELLIAGTSPEVVFGEMYYSDAWQSIFRVDNSFVLWGLALVVALMARAPVFIALCGAVMLHLTLDFPLHNDDARAHFWPITNWKFISPVSYWDGKYYGHIVGPIEIALAIAACVYCWRKFTGRLMRGLIVALGLMEAAPVIMFGIMFSGGQ